MMKKHITIFLFILLVLTSFAFVSAKQDPQVIIGTEEGISIIYPQWPNIKLGQHYYFFVHAYNETDGVLLTNTTTDCYFHIHNLTGEYVFDNELIYNSTTESYEYYMSPAGFTKLGIFSYLISCNHSNHYAGTVSGLFEVTTDGEAPKTNTGTADIAILIFILAIAFGLFACATKKDWSESSEYVNLIARKAFLVLGIYFMVLNTVMVATIADNSGIPLTGELYAIMEILGWAGYLAMAFFVVKTLFDTLGLWKADKHRERFGE